MMNTKFKIQEEGAGEELKLPSISTIFQGIDIKPARVASSSEYLPRVERGRSPNFSTSLPTDFHHRLNNFTYPERATTTAMNVIPRLPEIQSRESNLRSNFSPGLSISIDNRLPPISSIFSMNEISIHPLHSPSNLIPAFFPNSSIGSSTRAEEARFRSKSSIALSPNHHPYNSYSTSSSHSSQSRNLELSSSTERTSGRRNTHSAGDQLESSFLRRPNGNGMGEMGIQIPGLDELGAYRHSPTFSSSSNLTAGGTSLPGSPRSPGGYLSPRNGLIGLETGGNETGNVAGGRGSLGPSGMVTGGSLGREITPVGEDVLRYGCEFCPKRFARPSSLKIHLHSHTGEKPYDCSQCGRSFSVQSNLRRHAKVHEKEAGGNQDSSNSN